MFPNHSKEEIQITVEREKERERGRKSRQSYGIVHACLDRVTAPALTISDDSGRIVSKERHLKAGSVLRLRCEARDVLESLNESVVWTRGDETLTEDVR